MTHSPLSLRSWTCLLMSMCANAMSSERKYLSPYVLRLGHAVWQDKALKKTWEAEIHKRRYRTRYAEKWMEGMIQSNLTTTKTHKKQKLAQKMAQAIYSWERCCWMSNIYYWYLIFPLKFTPYSPSSHRMQLHFLLLERRTCVLVAVQGADGKETVQVVSSNYWG